MAKQTKTTTKTTTKTNASTMVYVVLETCDLENNRHLKRYMRKCAIAYHEKSKNTFMFIGANEHIINMIHWFFNNGSLVAKINAIAC